MEAGVPRNRSAPGPPGVASARETSHTRSVAARPTIADLLQQGAVTGGIPDARDGLTRLERVIVWKLSELERERGGAPVPTAMLYGNVVEHVTVSVEEFQAALQRLVGRGVPGRF